jgi:hypothetical protein
MLNMKTRTRRHWGLFRNRQSRVTPRPKARLKLELFETRDCPSSSIPLNFFNTVPEWTAIGPAPIVNGFTPGGLSTSGRVSGIAVDPSNPDRIFLTAASGGVWRTLDGGDSWTPLTWNVPGIPEPLRTLNMGAIGIAPSDPNIIYAVQGEGDDSTTGFGVMKSTDGGDTWALLGTSTLAPLSTHSIAIDNLDPNIVYITAESTVGHGNPFDARPGGIFRTLDGGATWSNITAASGIFGGGTFFTDVELARRTSTTEPNILYCALGFGGGGLFNGIYRSINANAPSAAAVTWNLSIGGSTLLPGTGPGDIQISMSRQLPSTIYASIANTNQELLGVYKTTDSGFNWQRIMSTPNFLGTQANYDNMIAVSPFDPNICIVGGQTQVLITRDGGLFGDASWTDISAINGFGPHVDHHAGVFDSNGDFLNGNDGGIHKLIAPASPTAANWVSLNGNNLSNPTVTALNTVQFVSVALHPRDANLALGGSQDNGTKLFNDNIGWQSVDGGDGGKVIYDFDNPLNAVHMTQARGPTFMRFSRDGGLTWTPSTTQPPNTNAQNTLFYAPMVIDPSNSQRFFFGSDQIAISEDGGVTWGTDYTFPGGQSVNIPGTPSTGVPPPFGPIPITAIGVGRASGGVGVIYVAHADGQLYRLIFAPPPAPAPEWVIDPNVVTNGATFGPAGPAGVGVITEIIVDPQNPNIMYVVGSGGVARTLEALKFIDPADPEPVPPVWTKLNGNLPGFFSATTIQLDPKNFSDPNDDVLYVGGTYGVFHMNNPGGSTFSWTRTGGRYDPATGRGLPDVRVSQLVLNTTTGILGVGTYGAGMWQLQVRGLIRGQKFEDLNGNGVREMDEPGVPGVFIRLLNNDNPNAPIEIANTVTDSEGFYVFRSLTNSQLTATNYLIVEVNPPGSLQSTAPLEFMNLTEQSTFDISDPSVGWDPTRVLIGNFRTTSISGVKYDDRNTNGVRDAGEPGLPGWVIFLDANDNGSRDPDERFETTDSTGAYTFTNLGPGTLLGMTNPDTFNGQYILREELQAGWIQTSVNPDPISLLSGQAVTGINFGNVRIGRITGSKFEDIDGDGVKEPGEPPLAGFVFNLTNVGTGQVLTVQSDANGNVQFFSLPAGTYRLREVVPAGFTQTTADPADFVLANGQQLDNAFDFGNFRNIAITGTKFNDLNGNGTRDTGEPGLAGFVFRLINAANGTVIAETTSSANGSFAFPNRGPLPNGASYRVREVQQTGWFQTNPDPADIAPRSGQNVALSFGNFRGVTVSGVVYLDSNFNGVRDFGERGVPGSLIQLIRNGAVVDTRFSAVDGTYSFTVVGPGAYQLVLPPRNGVVNTAPPNGYTFVTVSGVDIGGQDFGVARTSVTVTGLDAGGDPRVIVRDATTNAIKMQFNAYDVAFRGGVSVAVGYINNDTIPDIITGAGAGGGPHVRVFDGTTGAELFGFMAYEITFTGGVYVASGDVDGDGFDDIITGTGQGGGPFVKVFSGADRSLIRSFFAYNPAFRGGVTIAVGDTDNDGRADIATGAGPTGGPHAKVFDGASNSETMSLFPYDINFRGGVFVALGDVNGDGRDDLITGPGMGGGPHVRVFNGTTGQSIASFLAYSSPSPGFPWASGTRVASYDVNFDGRDDLILSPGRGQQPRVRILNGGSLTPIFDFQATDPSFLGGIFVGGG